LNSPPTIAPVQQQHPGRAGRGESVRDLARHPEFALPVRGGPHPHS